MELSITITILNLINGAGAFITRDGRAFQAVYSDRVDFSDPIPLRMSNTGYYFIADCDIKNKGVFGSYDITDEQGNTFKGKHLHRVVVFTFNDCNGRPLSKGIRSFIDHKDMNKTNNKVENLQCVSDGVNIFRAYYLSPTDEHKKLLRDFLSDCDEIDRFIFETEVRLDLEGKY